MQQAPTTRNSDAEYDADPFSRAGRGRIPRGMAAALVALLLAPGCGKRGSPYPPEPRGPLPSPRVAARQIGRSAVVGFEVPRARGSKPAQQPIQAELIRIAYPAGMAAPVDPEAFRRRGELIRSLEGDPLEAGTLLRLTDDRLDELADSGVGHTLRYAVRVLDRKRRSSPLVVADDLVLLPGAPAPRQVGAEPTADGIRLTWQAPPGDAPFLFNLYRSEPDGPRPLAPLNPLPLGTPEYLDSALAHGRRYEYVVRVVLAEGRPYREGETSAPIVVLFEDRFAPAAPLGLVAVQEGPAVRLFWNPSAERDVAGYRVYRREGEGDWTRIGPELVEGALHLDTEVRAGQRLSYRISALDRARPPNESERSDPVELIVVEEPVAPGRETP